MSWFCKHDWEAIVKTIAKPAKSITDVYGMSPRNIQMIIGGSTEVLLKCKKCPKTKIETMMGIQK